MAPYCRLPFILPFVLAPFLLCVSPVVADDCGDGENYNCCGGGKNCGSLCCSKYGSCGSNDALAAKGVTPAVAIVLEISSAMGPIVTHDAAVLKGTEEIQKSIAARGANPHRADVVG
eukprot:TRINITY_DN942_c0_g1_i1.p1 TRINITY_DN942_c0_g1~~TRINITY_DN942_c0_g1_i1.p1  ORF type:complete len:117 (+),score=5.97 TRINITY_DN942_c0_g1_i1:43-393(+)